MNPNDMRASVWGPHYWFFLHTVSMLYPQSPNAITKKRYYELIQHFPLFIPGESMSKKFEQMLNDFPVSAYLDSRDSLMKWMHFVHNKMNEKLEKPTLTYSESMLEYEQKYKQRNTSWMGGIQWRTRVLFVLVLFALCMVAVYLFKR